jgi:multiple sugar transport system substrate-binding protein
MIVQQKKWKIVFVAAALLLSALAAYHALCRWQALKVIRVGVFAGSNWNVPAGDSYALVDTAIKSFEAEHPDVKVTYVSGIKKEDYAEWLAEQVLDGKEPDVFFVLADDFNLYASTGVLKGLDPLEAGDDSFSSDDYYQAALNYGQYANQQYALPFESVPTLMFVNKTLLEGEGVSMPDNNWTWQDFLAICRKVTKDTDGDGIIDQFGFYDYNWQQAVVTNGLELFRSDGNFSYFADSRMEEAVKFMMKLNTVNHGYNVTAKDFDMGKVAFRPFTFAEYRTYKPYPWRIKKYTAFEWDCIKLPAGPSGKNTSELNTMLIGMSARTAHVDLAWAFLKKLCYDEEIQQLILSDSQGLPVRREVVSSEHTRQILLKDAPGDEKIDVSIISEVMSDAVVPPKFRKYASAMMRADNELRKIITTVAPFNNALNKLQKEINAYLQY